SASAHSESPMPLILRYFDVALVALAAPIMLLIGVPAVGYAVGAGSWIALRAVGIAVERAADAAEDARTQIGLRLGYMLARLFAVTQHKNNAFQIQNEFKLTSWVHLGVLSINRAVLYLFLAAVCTVVTMVFIARRMQTRPNRVQTAVEVLYSLMRDNIARGNMPDEMAAKWFPFLGALFLFIWYSNLIGYLPLPTNTEEKFNVLGAHIPSFALYAATANVSVPLILALVVFLSFNIEGVRA